MMRKTASILLVCLLSAVNMFPQQPVSDAEKKAFETLKYSLSFAALAKDAIWPGFDISRYAFVLTDPGSGAYLIGFEKAPEGSTQLNSTVIDSPVFFTRDNRVFSGNTAQIVAGKSTAVIQIDSIAPPDRGLESGLGLVFHE